MPVVRCVWVASCLLCASLLVIDNIHGRLSISSENVWIGHLCVKMYTPCATFKLFSVSSPLSSISLNTSGFVSSRIWSLFYNFIYFLCVSFSYECVDCLYMHSHLKAKWGRQVFHIPLDRLLTDLEFGWQLIGPSSSPVYPLQTLALQTWVHHAQIYI